MREELPVEAYERLFLALAGDSVSSILASRETRVDREIDTEDFASAAERDESRSRLYVVEGEEDGLKSICSPEQMQRINTINRRWVFCWWTSCRAIRPGPSRGAWEPTCYLMLLPNSGFPKKKGLAL